MLHCGLHDGGTLAAGGIAGQNQQVTADVSLRAVLAGDVVPPVYQPVDRDDGSGADGGKAGAVGAGTGPDVNRAFRHAAVRGEEIILIDRNIIGGHIAGIAVIIDLVPAGGAGIQQSHSHGLVQRGDNAGGGIWLGTQAQGSTGGAAGADGDLSLSRGKGGQRQGGERGKHCGLYGLFH